MTSSNDTGAHERPTGDILPALYHLEQGVQAFASVLDLQQTAMLELLSAYSCPPLSVETAARLHAENIAHLAALRRRLQALRHQLSAVLP
ncbi:MAG: hypothetical protein Q8M01_06785 [Rubrivivax sp.]|nr:hypothetical protein [Rubrivivax sp.]